MLLLYSKAPVSSSDALVPSSFRDNGLLRRQNGSLQRQQGFDLEHGLTRIVLYIYSVAVFILYSGYQFALPLSERACLAS